MAYEYNIAHSYCLECGKCVGRIVDLNKKMPPLCDDCREKKGEKG